MNSKLVGLASSRVPLVVLSALFACAHSKPGTHVEIIDSAGKVKYVGGAAAPGLSQSVACTAAVRRTVVAIAERFAEENEDVADEVAEATGASDGRVFLRDMAMDDALSAALQDQKFDPIEHLCSVTVRWEPPIFVKDAAMAYAERRKAAELGKNKPAAATTAPASAATTAPASAATTAPASAAASAPAAPPAATAAPPASVPAAPAPAAVAPAPAPAPCGGERARLDKAMNLTQRADADLQECLRRTSGDKTICHRYVLMKQEAETKEGSVRQGYDKCQAVP